MVIDLRYPSPGAFGEGSLLDDVYSLWKLNSATLGFLPFEAFNDRARSGQVLAAVQDDTVVGYVLFDLPRTGQITLRHVCIAEAARGTGLARTLTDRVIADHPERLELAADCREDYGLHGFWSRLGMSPRAERPGRRQLGSVLTRWRRPLGQLDLLEAALLASKLPLAVLDANVVSDLCSAPHVPRARAQESAGLLADWMQQKIDYAVSVQLDQEFSRTIDPVQRAALRTGSQHWVRLRTTRPDDEALEHDLAKRLATAIAQDASISEDLLHLADAIRAEAAYFVTNDDTLIERTADWLLADFGVEAIRPHVLIGRTRSGVGQPSFVPRLISSVDLDWEPLDRLDGTTLQNAFTNHHTGERGRSLLQRIANERSHPDTTQVQVLSDGHTPWALLAYRPDHDSLYVPLLRVAPGPQALTVALQLTRYLRREAVRLGCTTVIVEDTVQEVVGEALREDGYAANSSGWTAEPRTGFENHPSLLPQEAADRERIHYPLAITGTGTPAAVVPIRPRYAETLLGYAGDTLLQLRRTTLGILRQHVYFHTPAGPALTAPTRLLWYVTADKLSRTRRMVATSRLIGSEILPAAEAHAVYRELGVLSLSEIRAMANDAGEVHVVRFEDTELLPRELGRSDVAALNSAHNVRGNFLTIREVPSGYFDDLMTTQLLEAR
ncbi:GNAT family N-acetyltransferase [Curtobacterium sp. MCPF17_002]|uniref:GNAT family N-acetyltransferase n=1 Tax=Curtobacterium sp. MCPF17_002 TaxID=2175645 RepID=UPI0011B43039|nr:GNAT family N-acetyltransferase [Curtobacterium sp. MCPF17_002]WIB77985.1 GNAT family N-acetyltransferase [Curtobacterium sp. MCPF17_002]